MPPKKRSAAVCSDAEWRERLTPEQYRVLRERGTEPAGTGRLLYNKERGMYVCGGCGAALFSSDAKFDSGTGWPSFFDAMPSAVELRQDDSYGMRRVEAVCRKCGGHLGHVFDDGPRPTGRRYCINSAALGFEKGGPPARDDFRGIVIEESLKSAAVIKDLKVLETKTEQVTAADETPWLKKWTLHTVEIPEKDVDAVAERLRKSLDTTHTEWYADFKNSKLHFIIFSKRIFRVQRSKPEQYRAVVKYGLSLGIPEHQLDFSPQIK